MKYIKLFIFIVLLFFISIFNCYAKDNNDNKLVSDKVFDFADIYSEEEEEKLNSKIESYIKSTKIDSVIVTTKDLGNKKLGDYASQFYSNNKFKKNTVLFIIYMNDLEPEIFMYCVGKKTTKYYSNERIGQILKYVYTDIGKKRYYSASDKYLIIIKGFYDIDNGDYYLGDDGKLVKYIPWVEIVILSLSLSFIVVMISIYGIKHSNKTIGSNLDSKLDNGSIVVSTIKDELVDTVILK